MQKARLFYTTWGSPRRAILSLALIGVFAAALVFWLGAAPALAHDPPPGTKPGPVTNIMAKVGDTEVELTWRLPTATEPPHEPQQGETYTYANDKCVHTRIDLLLKDIEDDDSIVATIFLPASATSYVVTDLKASTEYEARLVAYSSKCTDHYSILVYKSFTTNADNDDMNDPSKPMGEQKMPPKPPTNLTIIKKNNTSAMITWQEPNNTGRCAHSYYAMYMADLKNLMNNAYPVRKIDITGEETEVSGLTSGGKYELYFASYSLDCAQYSPPVTRIYTHE